MQVYDSVDEYIEAFSDLLETADFYETESARTTDRFGRMAHVFSTFEGRTRPTDAEPRVRGINSIQLMHDGERWWLVNIIWEGERPERPLPKKYLKTEE